MSKRQNNNYCHRLHDNIKALSLLHQALATDLLKKCLTVNMFEVPNKAGFHQVMHFLLSILNPEKCKNKYRWPLFDKESEKQFLTGVRLFIEEVHKDFPEADIPKVFPSFFVNPGGVKFSHFMWRLSVFVLQVSLQAGNNAHSVLVSPSRVKTDDEFRESKVQAFKLTAYYGAKQFAKKQKSIADLRLEAEDQARLMSHDLKWIWRRKEELKEKVKEAEFLAFPNESKNSLIDPDDMSTIASWRKDVADRKQQVADLIDQLEQSSARMEHCYQILQSGVKQQTSPVYVDGSKLSVARQQAAERTTSTQNTTNEIVLTSFVSSFNKDLRTLQSCVQSPAVQSFQQSIPHEAVEQTHLKLADHATKTNNIYVRMAELAPVMYRFVEEYFNNYQNSDGARKLLDQVSYLMPTPPFEFKNVPLEAGANVTLGNSEGYNLQLSPEPNKLLRSLKNDAYYNQMLTPYKQVMEPRTTHLSNTCDQVTASCCNQSTRLATLQKANKDSSLKSPQSLKFGSGHTSLMARYKIKERFLIGSTLSVHSAVNTPTLENSSAVLDRSVLESQITMPEQNTPLVIEPKIKNISFSQGNSNFDVKPDVSLQTPSGSMLNADLSLFSPLNSTFDNNTANSISRNLLDLSVKREFNDSEFFDSVPTAKLLSLDNTPYGRPKMTIKSEIVDNTPCGRPMMAIKSEVVDVKTSLKQGDVSSQIVYLESFDTTADVLELDISNELAPAPASERLREDLVSESSPSGIYMTAPSSQKKRLSLDNIIARYKNLKKAMVDSDQQIHGMIAE